MQSEVELPAYVKRAITSKLARREPYSWLGPEGWEDIAQHVYRDEVVRCGNTTFLPRGTQNSYGHGRRRTLNGILCSAIVDHGGVTDHVPHYQAARRLYEAVTAAQKLKETKFILVDIGE